MKDPLKIVRDLFLIMGIRQNRKKIKFVGDLTFINPARVQARGQTKVKAKKCHGETLGRRTRRRKEKSSRVYIEKWGDSMVTPKILMSI